MAFENLGIGGVLSFESRGAVANMGTAQRGFMNLSRAASTAQANVGKIASGLGQFSLIGAGGLVAVGMGIKKWVGEGMTFNKEMETSKISIATIMATVTKTPLAENLIKAGEAMTKLNKIAADAPGETKDILGIFQQLTGPILAAGGTMNELYDNTKGTAILAGVLKRSFNDTGAAMSKLTAGAYEAGNDIHLMLKSMGLLNESTKEWKALLPEQRLKRINQILGNFAQSGELVGKTADAMAGTAKSNMKIMAGAFAEGITAQATKGMSNFNDAFFKNSTEWIAQLKEVGETFGRAVNFMVGEVKIFINNLRAAFKYMEDKISGVGIKMDNDVLKKVVHIGAQFILLVTAISPVIAVVGFLGSKIMAIFSIVQGLAGLFMALAAPLLPILAIGAAIFALFRMEGESIGATFGRAFNYVQEIADRLWAAIQLSLGALQQAFANISASGAAMWAGIQPGLDLFKASIVGLIDLVMGILSAVIPILSNIVLGVTVMFEAIRPGLEAVFNGIMTVIMAVVDGLNFIMPKIMAVLGPVVDVIMKIGEKLAIVFGKILGLLRPILDAIAYVLKEVIFPIAGWLIDTFGPVFIAIWKAIGTVISALEFILSPIIDAIKWLMGKVGGTLKLGFEAIAVVLKVIGTIIDTVIITPIKWLITALGKVKDALTWISEKMIGGGMGSALKEQTEQSIAALNAQIAANKMNDEVQAATLAAQHAKALHTQSIVSQLTADIEKMSQQLVADVAEAKLVEFVKNVAINAKNPDVNVKVGINQTTSMCVNGRNIASAHSAHETEVSERAGFVKTPWQTSRATISGVST